MRLGTVEQFCEAAKKLSFTAAAESLGTTPSAISKAVGRLEDQLGAKLFQRSTRSIRLTDDGRAYYETCQQALTQIEEAGEALGRGRISPRGTLRVSLPFSYGIKRIVPLMPRYVERYGEQVKVMLSLSNSKTDFISDDFDLSVRLGPVADSRLVARPLHDAQFRVVAAPAYLRQHGIPRRPDDLGKHRCVDLILPDTGRPIPWQFCEAGRCWNAKISSGLAFDHPIAALTAALNGAGLARLLDFTVEAELRAGDLVEVLADFRPPGERVSAVYPSKRHLSAKIRSFIDFLVEAQRDSDPPGISPRASARR